MRRLTVNLTDDSARALRQLARRRQCARSELVREAVAEYLRNQRPQPKGIGAYDSGRTDVSERAKELLREGVKRKYRVRLPLIPSKHPGTLNLTNADIEDILTGPDV